MFPKFEHKDGLQFVDPNRMVNLPIYRHLSDAVAQDAEKRSIGTCTSVIDNEAMRDNTFIIPVDLDTEDDLVCLADKGDRLMVEKTNVLLKNDIAAVLVDGNKQYFRHFDADGNSIILRPTNGSYKPLVFSDDEKSRLDIIGVVRSVIKDL